jgi:hypothetical protein
VVYFNAPCGACLNDQVTLLKGFFTSTALAQLSLPRDNCVTIQGMEFTAYTTMDIYDWLKPIGL